MGELIFVVTFRGTDEDVPDIVLLAKVADAVVVVAS